MPLASVAHAGYRPQSASRRSIGTVKAARGAYNLFPAIADAFPGALSDVVVETTEAIASDAAEHAPEARAKRSPSDPDPGTLKESVRVTYRKGKATDDVVTGKIDFKAKSPNGHPFAFYEEVGTATQAGRPFLVPAVQRGRQLFNGLVGALESRLPK